MENIKLLQVRMNFLMEQAEAYKKEVQKLISDLPDNPNIKRIGDGCAFTMGVSSLSKTLVLSPLHYDFKYQYKMINELIDKTSLSKISEKLQEIIKDKKFKIGSDTILLHDTVIKNIEGIL